MKISAAHLALALLLSVSIARGEPLPLELQPAEISLSPTAGLAPEVAKMVADLKSDDFHIRDQAANKLLNHPESRAALEVFAFKKDQTELGDRAAEILKLMDWGVRSETPPEVLELLRKCRFARPELPEDLTEEDRYQFQNNIDKQERDAKAHRPKLMAACFESGDEQILLRLIRDDYKFSASEPNYDEVTSELLRISDKFITEGNANKSIALYERVMMMETGDLGQQAYAGLICTLGKSQEAIDKWNKIAAEKGDKGERARRILAELYFLSGDIPRAVSTSESFKCDKEQLLHRAAHWDALAKELEDAARSGDTERIGKQIVMLDIAGKYDEAAKVAARSVNLQYSEDPTGLVASLLAIGRPEDAALVAREDGPMIVPILIYEKTGRHKKAMVLLKDYLDTLEEGDLPYEDFAAAHVRLLFKLNRIDEGKALIKKYIEKNDNEGGLDRDFMMTLHNLGQIESLDGMLATYAKSLSDNEALLSSADFNRVHRRQGQAANFPGAIFVGIRACFPEESEAQHIARLRKFMEDKCDAETVKRIKARAIRIVSDWSYEDDEPYDFYYTKFQLLLSLGGEREAEALAREVSSGEAPSEFRRVFAEMLERKNKFEEALSEYRKTLEEFPGYAAFAYRISCMQKKLGRNDEAKLWAERAKLFACGNAYHHADLAEAMHKAGDHKEALFQARMAIRCGIYYDPAADKITEILKHAGELDEVVRLWEKMVCGSVHQTTRLHDVDFDDIVSGRTKLADAYLAVGQKAKAIHSLEIAAAYSPDDAKLAGRLKQLKTEIPADGK